MTIKHTDHFGNKTQLIEQCNYHLSEEIWFYYWMDRLYGDFKRTVCIWRIKYKN